MPLHLLNSNMRTYIAIFLAAILLTSCKEKAVDKSAFTLTADVMLPVTPVKDQGKSSLCWDYAMLATIETERLGLGDSVNLSPHYIARCWLQEQAERYYLTGGKQDITLRGMGSTLLQLMQKYGVMPFDTYNPRKDVDYGEILAQIREKADIAIAHHDGLKAFSADIERLLDKEITAVPRSIQMLGATYTPLEFAHSVYMKGDYEYYTSFTHRPKGKAFVLEVPDNVFADEYVNVSLDSLVLLAKESIEDGHPVFWEGDTSNRYYSDNGKAPYNPKKPVTESERQTSFETFKTTDDHAMCLVGLAHDNDGTLYFIAKNSWGKDYGHDGYCYLSEQYFRIATIAIILSTQ